MLIVSFRDSKETDNRIVIEIFVTGRGVVAKIQEMGSERI